MQNSDYIFFAQGLDKLEFEKGSATVSLGNTSFKATSFQNNLLSFLNNVVQILRRYNDLDDPFWTRSLSS